MSYNNPPHFPVSQYINGRTLLVSIHVSQETTDCIREAFESKVILCHYSLRENAQRNHMLFLDGLLFFIDFHQGGMSGQANVLELCVGGQ